MSKEKGARSKEISARRKLYNKDEGAKEQVGHQSLVLEAVVD